MTLSVSVLVGDGVLPVTRREIAPAGHFATDVPELRPRINHITY